MAIVFLQVTKGKRVCLEYLVEKAKQRSLTARAELPESVPAPVEKGQRLGTLTVSAGEETLAEIPLVAAGAVERQSLGQLWLSLVRTLCGQL